MPRAAVRLLHAGHDHGAVDPAAPNTDPRERSARGSRATSAAAPATRTSSGPSGRRAPTDGATRRRRACRGGDRPPDPGAETATDRGRQARLRKEDARLVTGRTRWTDNITLPGMLHLAILRSPMAHARVTASTCSAAPSRRRRRLQRRRPRRRPGHARLRVAGHRGHGAAALPADGHRRGALRRRRRRRGRRQRPGQRRRRARGDRGRLRAAAGRPRHGGGAGRRRAAGPRTTPAPTSATPTTPKRRRRRRRQSGRGRRPATVHQAAADPERDGAAQRSSSTRPRDRDHDLVTTQVPHIVRVFLAASTGIPEHKIRVIAPDVGGGFGSKLAVYAEEAIACSWPSKLGRPVKWTETRCENMQATHPRPRPHPGRRDRRRRDGTVTGLQVDLLANMGAYLASSRRASRSSALHVPRHLQVRGVTELHRRVHQQDADRRLPGRRPARRRPSSSSGSWTSWRTELGMDPIEVRRRNWIAHDEFPFPRVAGLSTTPGNYEAATDKAMELLGYDELRAEQAARPRAGDPVQLGIGVSTYTEMCGLAPSRWLGAAGYGAGGWEARDRPGAAHGKVEVSRHVPARPGPRDDVRARSSPTRWACRSTTSRSCTATRGGPPMGPGHLRLAVAGGRRHRHGQGVREGHGEGQAAGRAPARVRPGRPRVRGRAFTVKGHAGVGQDDPGVAFAAFAAHTCPRASSRISTPTPRSTRPRSRSRTARTSARRGRHRDRHGDHPRTSPSTTSARSSTR